MFYVDVRCVLYCVYYMGNNMVCILIVDDLLLQLLGIQCIVEKFGYEILIVIDGVVGVEVVKVELFDLVLMDVVMFNFNGFQVICMLLCDVVIKYILVILVIIKDQDIDCMWGMWQGVKVYIIKLFFEDELFEVLEWVFSSQELLVF